MLPSKYSSLHCAPLSITATCVDILYWDNSSHKLKIHSPRGLMLLFKARITGTDVPAWLYNRDEWSMANVTAESSFFY